MFKSYIKRHSDVSRFTSLCVYRPVHLGSHEISLVYEDGATCIPHLGAVCFWAVSFTLGTF